MTIKNTWLAGNLGKQGPCNSYLLPALPIESLLVILSAQGEELKLQPGQDEENVQKIWGGMVWLNNCMQPHIWEIIFNQMDKAARQHT